MAGFLQVGDFVNFGRLAWQVYQYGWREEHNAAKQYLEFGRDVRGLAQSLDILERVVAQAQQSLFQQGVYNVPLRWDKLSLIEIIGDYEQTLQECRFLIEDNYRYRASAGPIRNLEWNALVQPNADRLRTRLLLHNSKIQLVLKPFEIDLLSRIRQDISLVRQDIHRVHQDLRDQIERVHHDVLRLIGVMVPDLEQALAQQEELSLHFLDIPPRIADALSRAAYHGRPDFDAELGLEEMADAFVLHFHNSTKGFQSGLVVESRIPPLEQYVNLLKCIWLMQRIRGSSKLEEAYAGSHWPSYITQLETDLSLQCERFHPKQELIGPDLSGLTPHMLSIWPETQALPLVDVVTQEELMEEVLDVSLSSGNAGNVKRRLQMLRRTGQNNKRFRVNISGSETDVTGKARRHVETIDFDLKSALVSPMYALPSGYGGFDVILRKDERIARLAFQKLKDVLKFQHALTGYEPKSGYTQYNAVVTFVLDGRRETLIEKACVQLWVAKEREGKVMTTRDAAPEAPPAPPSPFAPSPAGDAGTFEMFASPTGFSGPSFFSHDPFSQQRPFDGSSFSQPGRVPRSDTMSSFGSLPGQRPGGGLQPGLSIPRRPVNQFSPSPSRHLSGHTTVDAMPIPASPPSRGVFSPMRSSSQQLSPPAVSRTRESSLSTLHSRTFSISSDISHARSNTSSSGSDAPTVTVTTGANTTGTLHVPPTKPMLVLFTQDPRTNGRSLVAFPLDRETSVNPGLCFCSRSGRDGASCRIASLQRRGGKEEMIARRFEVSGEDGDWNVAKLARGWRDPRTGSNGTWKGVTRISIEFPDAAARIKFAGTPNLCGCQIRLASDLTACIEKNHRGLIGEVQERFRRNENKYAEVRGAVQHVVVNGLPGSGRPV